MYCRIQFYAAPFEALFLFLGYFPGFLGYILENPEKINLFLSVSYNYKWVIWVFWGKIIQV